MIPAMLAPTPAPPPMVFTPKPTDERFAVKCLECGKKFLTKRSYPECPKCGSADVEMA